MRKPRSPFPWTIHPVWRGIGCIMLVIIPTVSVGLAQAVLPYLDTSQDGALARNVTLPLIGEIQHIYAQILLATFFTITIFLILTVISSFLYSFLGGDRDEEVARYTKRDPYRYK
jgi:hypothetical protein